MSMYRRERYNHGVKRLTFEITVAIAGILLILCIIFGINLFTSSTSDNALGTALVKQAQAEEAEARACAGQLSRLGGSTTTHMLAETRQHLYALATLNTLQHQLLGTTDDLIDQSLINSAISCLDQSTELLLTGASIETPLNNLWLYLNQIAVLAAEL